MSKYPIPDIWATIKQGDLLLDGIVARNKIGMVADITDHDIRIDWIEYLIDIYDGVEKPSIKRTSEFLERSAVEKALEHGYLVFIKNHVTEIGFEISLDRLIGHDPYIINDERQEALKKKQ